MSLSDAILGISAGGQKPLWAPSRLIEVFCAPGLRSGFRDSGRKDESRSNWYAGFCSYAGKDAYGAGVDGFDDGHELWGDLTSASWALIQDPGDRQFPYAFYMEWKPTELMRLEAAFDHAGSRGVDLAERIDQLRASPDGHWCMVSYCEGDFGVDVYDDEAAYRREERRVRTL